MSYHDDPDTPPLTQCPYCRRWVYADELELASGEERLPGQCARCVAERAARTDEDGGEA